MDSLTVENMGLFFDIWMFINTPFFSVYFYSAFAKRIHIHITIIAYTMTNFYNMRYTCM